MKEQQLKVKIEDGREAHWKPGTFMLCLFVSLFVTHKRLNRLDSNFVWDLTRPQEICSKLQKVVSKLIYSVFYLVFLV